jgi:peptidylprolyl isomerase
VFDSSADREPLEFELGSGQVIEGFDNAVEGMETGESKKVDIPPAQAYGEREEALAQTVDRSDLPPDLEFEVGMVLQATQGNGMPLVLHVTGLSDKDVTLDANHPLAGKTLTFELELVEIL